MNGNGRLRCDRNRNGFDPTVTTEMHGLWDAVSMWIDDHPASVQVPLEDRMQILENRIRRLHSAVVFSTVMTVGMTVIAIVALLQLGGWIRWFA